jgi:hypothetical protein
MATPVDRWAPLAAQLRADAVRDSPGSGTPRELLDGADIGADAFGDAVRKAVR